MGPLDSLFLISFRPSEFRGLVVFQARGPHSSTARLDAHAHFILGCIFRGCASAVCNAQRFEELCTAGLGPDSEEILS